MKFAGAKEKGVAGLNVFLSILAMLFVIGMMVMVFVLAGAKLEDSTTDTDAIDVINSTKMALKESVTWFSIIITLGGLVVLILLVVIMIGALRGSGLMGGGGA